MAVAVQNDRQQPQVHTADATVTTLLTLNVAVKTNYVIEAHIHCVQTNTNPPISGAWTILASVRLGGAGTAELYLTGAQTNPSIVHQDTSDNALACTIDVTGTTARIRVTGKAATALDWTADVFIRQIAST